MSGHILIVEDQPDNRQILRDMLRHAGYRTEEAVTGEDAVARIAADPPDLVLMDLQLPGLDGYATTRRIRSDPALPAMPIIAVTSFALAGDDLKAREAGCDDYIAKPYSPRMLMRKIREHLDRL